MKRVLIIAGESSGDLHGSSLMKHMKAIESDIEFKGIGGKLMIIEGLDAVRHVRDMNFMGFVEVIRHLPFIRRTMIELISILDSWNPDLVILIDYPGFNLKFAPHAKQRKIPVMYYISPQLWAWHKSRVKIVKKNVDRMVVLFDFEKDFYSSHGVEADFVGHPLLDIVQPSQNSAEFRASLGAGDTSPIIGILPGSRKQEIERMLPPMIESLSVLKGYGHEVTAALGCASEIDDSYYESFIRGTDIKTLRDRTYDIMAHSDVLVVTSGTATLEAGILGTPMIIVYRTSFLTYHIGKSLVNIPNIGLINIVAGSRIVPELWQYDVSAKKIAELADNFLKNGVLRETTSKALVSVKKRLGERGASERAARIAFGMIHSQ
ncbi:lipid-A-disaccharide synthase [Candidatus Latescibacterota bacterium]